MLSSQPTVLTAATMGVFIFLFGGVGVGVGRGVKNVFMTIRQLRPRTLRKLGLLLQPEWWPIFPSKLYHFIVKGGTQITFRMMGRKLQLPSC